MKHLVIPALILFSPFMAQAACPAITPTTGTSDMVMRFKSGTTPSGSMSASSLSDKTEAGTLIYDTANNALRLCNGTSWMYITQLYSPSNASLVITQNTPIGASITLEGRNATAAIKNRRWIMFNMNEYGTAPSTTTGLSFWEYTDVDDDGAYCDSDGGACGLRFILAPNGKVGINTSVPTKTLTILDTVNAGISLSGTSGNTHIDLQESGVNKTNFYWSIANQIAYLNTFNAPLQIGGNVGIGAAPTTNRLTVDGTGAFASLIASNTWNQSKLTVIGYGSGRGYGLYMQPSLDSAQPVLFLNVAGATVGGINTNATTTTYATTSDYRLKENVTPIEGALPRLNALKPSRFNFKNDPQNTLDGFIAHEVQTIAPYAVTGDKDAVDENNTPAYQQVDYGKLTPLLTAAMQELSAKVDALEAENAKLKSKIELLEIRQNY